MIILVADTSVLIDLERAGLLDLAFQGPDTFAIPDFLYQRELTDDIGSHLLELGLQILELSEAETAEAQRIFNAHPRLSLPDCAACVGAQRPDHELLTADSALRALAEARGVRCHGVLWVMDRLFSTGMATAAQLHAGLTKLRQHPRCFLPAAEVERRLKQWAP